jgi:uncharacterized protein (TIGR02588 family)
VAAIEWVTGGIGLFIVVSTLAFIGYEALRGDSGQPGLEVSVDTTHKEPSGFSVTVVVRNASRRAAAEVVVEGVLRPKNGHEQRSQVRLDYVPGLSERRATLVFGSPPSDGGVAVRILGYTTP